MKNHLSVDLEERPNPRSSKKIVIIGCGLTGMAISQSLSEAKIDHILIGAPPNDSPKLGESMNPEGSTELLNYFSKFSRFFHDKRLTIIGIGDYRVHCNFSGLGSSKRVRLFLNTLSPGLKIPYEMIHVDRIGLDQALYDSIATQSFVTRIEERVTRISVDEKSDRITELQLSNGETIQTDYVFDATNHLRLVAKAASIPCRFTSERQHVVYCHYHRDKSVRRESRDWEASTNLLRLDHATDGIDGFAWCIPLGDYISVGISVEAAKERPSNEEVLGLIRSAFARRGLHYHHDYPRASQIMSIPSQYYIHDRAYGTNWVLAGPSYCQIWYMSGSGVGTSLTTAYLAPQLVKTPLKTGKVYQNYMEKFLNTHNVIDWFESTCLTEMPPEIFQEKIFDWLMANIKRMAKYPLVRQRTVSSLFSHVASWLLNAGLLGPSHFAFEKHCPVERVSEKYYMWSPPAVSKAKESVAYG